MNIAELKRAAQPYWPIWLGIGLIFVGRITGRPATVIAGASLAVIGGVFIGVFWWYMRSVRRAVEMAEKEMGVHQLEEQRDEGAA